MLMRHTLLSAALVLAGVAAAQDLDAGVLPRGDEPLVVLDGGVQAPAQPVGRSASEYRVGARRASTTPVGRTGRIHAPVRSLVGVRGMEENSVWGIGIVDGLAGTGDSGELAKQLLRNILLGQGINIEQRELSTKNLAVVRVEANIGAGVKPGRTIDVRVSTIGDAKSLVGGTLAMTELLDHSGTKVYATAAGPVTVGGFSVSGEAASATKNHVTVGTLPLGGKVEREVPTRIVDEHGFIHLDARPAHDSFGNMVRITEAINRLYPGVADVTPDGRSIKVALPVDLPEAAHAAYLDSLLRQEVETDNLARVVINERTGVIVMGGDVRLRPGAVSQGNLIVTIAESPEASQPGPLSAGQTEVLERTALDVSEDDHPLVLVPEAVTLAEVVEVMNALGATPRDLISILTAMSDGGMLVAEIRRM
jgi:flagellar P-ring protein precursor FlgI